MEINGRSAHGCSKINDNAQGGGGALRYALHLRFLCPSPKKCSRSVQRCKSDPTSLPQKPHLDMEGERRFYLYNDMRVVFPQRHSDADEGKVCDFFFFWVIGILSHLKHILLRLFSFSSLVKFYSCQLGIIFQSNGIKMSN